MIIYTNDETGYLKRKNERVNYYKKEVEYWVDKPCAACEGTGIYDSNGSPECEGCEGTGIERSKPLYDLGRTDSSKLVGKTLYLKVNSYTELRVYINKRREIIYQYVDTKSKLGAKRVRRRLYFDYINNYTGLDWLFTDLEGNLYNLENFAVII